MAPQTRTNSQRNLIVTIVILGALAVIGYFALPFITEQLQKTTSSASGVVYKVEGTAEQAVITYTQPDGKISIPKGVDLPWTSQTLNIKSGIIVVLTAAAVSEGTVRCTILVGGKILDTNMDDPFIDKAICGGVIK